MIRTENLIPPGEILLEEFLRPMKISQNKLAMDIRIPTPRINAIVNGKRSITADTADSTLRTRGKLLRPNT